MMNNNKKIKSRIASFRNIKPARLRASAAMRSLTKETSITKDNLIMPLFYKEGPGSEPIASMPGIAKMGQEPLLREIERIQKLGINAILLFGSSSKKDSSGSAGYNEKSAFHKTLRRIKEMSDIILVVDVCLCAHTNHGHCGIVKKKLVSKGKEPEFVIDSDRTLKALAKMAVSFAQAGADVVAPSAMADGQVRAIREALDKDTLSQTAIMSYAAKYASNFYGPFRDIYDSAPSFGDRKTYQMNPANKKEALKEVSLDVEEGADIVMVKPALAYLDIISAVKQTVAVPVAAYNVSGEYSMLKAAAHKGWLDEKLCAMEMLTSIKRAGADLIITYWAKEATKWFSS